MQLALLFEVTPKPEAFDEYLAIAAKLRPALDASGGCLFIDRFRCVREPARILSLQIWRDEAALVKWRVDSQHHKAQTLGRTRVFDDYRLRIAQVLHAESSEGEWQPPRLNTYNDPSARPPRYLTIAESRQALGAGESYESLYRPGEFATVIDVPAPTTAPKMTEMPGAFRVRLCETERDYGMFDRRESPQYYPPLERHTP
ncbi:MAG: antibiotic biosynthesis monooxygenase family protein [Burkholderiaceae bacterium]